MKVRNSGADKKRSRSSANGSKRSKANGNPVTRRSNWSKKKAGLVVTASPAYNLPLDHTTYFSMLAYVGVTVDKRSKAAVLALQGKEWYPFGGEEMKQVVKRLMETTFDLRQRGIQHGISVQNTFTIYPALLTSTMLTEEFARVRQHNQNGFAKLWKSHMQSLLETHRNCMKPLCHEVHRRVQDNDRNKLKRTTAMFLTFCCGKIKNWNGCLKVTKEDAKPSDYIQSLRPQPTIVIAHSILQWSSCAVYCEQVKVLSNVHFHTAFLSCYYLYHIFNLAYTPDDKKIFTLFDQMSEASKGDSDTDKICTDSSLPL